MGFIALVKAFERTERNGAKVSDVTVDPGGAPTVRSEHFQGAGDDSYPLGTDYSLNVDIPRTGGSAVAGYIDPINQPKAEKGDKRIYSRQTSDGQVVAEIWLKNTGEIIEVTPKAVFQRSPNGAMLFQNENLTIEGRADGYCIINGAYITPSGDVVTASGRSLDKHPHNQGNDSGGNSEEPTAAPTITEEGPP